MKNFDKKSRYQSYQSGFSILEVLMGIAIFAIGMLALASLQGALTRSSAEAKVRSTAVNIAEQVIESQKGFTALAGGSFSYAGIVDIPPESAIKFDSQMTRNPTTPVGMVYTVTQDVTDYYYDLASDTDSTKKAFTTTAPTGVSIPDFKTIVVTATWGDNRDYVIDEANTAGNLDGGSVEVSATISVASVTEALRVIESTGDDVIAPDIIYTPGQNPDVVSLSLGDSKFKESLTPEPKVYRDNLETRFDVVTYSQSGAESLFLRREEFVAVSCDCTLRAASADNPGRTPAIWAGDEYTEPELVTKPFGVVSSNNVDQSSLCGSCCNDHHDASGSGDGAYDPSRPTTEYKDNGNHKHYSANNQGVLVEAAVGDDYVEACRFVRKDGFFRLTQDFRLEGLNTFPADYLVTQAQVDAYSLYVTNEVYIENDTTTYVPGAIALGTGYQLDANPPTVATAPRTAYGETAAADDLTNGYTFLPTTTSAEFQQLRSRSIYIDNLSNDLRTVISCIEGLSDTELATADKTTCQSGDVVLDKTGSFNILEIIPFFEVQTTYLNDWRKDTVGGGEFTLTNENVTTSDANGPTHSRGLVTKVLSNGNDMVHTIVNRGVVGLTSTDPINNLDYQLPVPPVESDSWPPGDIDVRIGSDTSEQPGTTITGTLSSSVGGLKAADVILVGVDATCNYVTTSGEFTCFVPDSNAGTAVIRLSNIQKSPKTVYVCSSHQYNVLGGSPGELEVVNNTVSSAETKDIILTRALEVPESPAEPYRIWLTETACPTGIGGIGT